MYFYPKQMNVNLAYFITLVVVNIHKLVCKWSVRWVALKRYMLIIYYLY